MAREAAGLTLQPTALVHEAWLRLGQEFSRTWENRAHFFGAASQAMRRILIERAHRKTRLRHGGEMEHRKTEARSELAAVQSLLGPKFPTGLGNGLPEGDDRSGLWYDWIEALLLLNEAVAEIQLL